MLSGFAYNKVLVDDTGQPIDYIVLEINDAFEKLTGLGRNIMGKRATEVIPGILTQEPNLINTFGKVALTRENVAFDMYFESLGVWFSVSAYSPGPQYFVSLYEDITDRKWAEESLRRLNEDLEERGRADDGTSGKQPRLAGIHDDLAKNAGTFSAIGKNGRVRRVSRGRGA